MENTHKLPDAIVPALRVVFCGTAAGTKSAAVGAYYAGPGNQFWSTLHEIGLTPRRLAPAEFSTLPTFGIGLTDIAKYRAGNDEQLLDSDFDVPGFSAKIERFKPKVAAFNGKKAAAVFRGCNTCDLSYGRQPFSIGTTVIWVLSSTSGGARAFWDMAHWRDLGEFLRSH